MMLRRRLLHTTKPRFSLLGDWLGFKKGSDKTNQDQAVKAEKTTVKKDLIKDQDDFETSSTKIVILNESNSPNFKPFNAATDMPDFKINQWKLKTLTPKTIEHAYTKDQITTAVTNIYQTLKNETPNEATALSDLKFRFTLTKEVQKTLGIDIPDLILTESHTVGHLNNEIFNIISKKFKYERNPNDINLRPEDFNAGNVYVNQELNEAEQSKQFKALVDKARSEL